MSPILFIGLGNPGPRYDRTRHNVGFWAVANLARAVGIAMKQRRFDSIYGTGDYGTASVVLAMPQTYMNLSGKAAAALCRHFRVAPTDVWVIYDDMDLSPGRLRLRRGGSAGGHHGVRSIIEALGTQDFGRIRIGIGRPPNPEAAADYVLARPTPAERDIIMATVDRAVAAATTIVRDGAEAAMNLYNQASTGG